MTNKETIINQHRCPRCGGTEGFLFKMITVYCVSHAWDNTEQDAEACDSGYEYKNIECQECHAVFRNPYIDIQKRKETEIIKGTNS